MGYYSPEQMKRLKEIGALQHFNTVIDSQYKRGTFSELDNEVADIYDKATGGKVSRNFSCKICVFNLYYNAGKLYRETEKWLQKERMRKAREAKNTNNKTDKDTIVENGKES